MTEAGKRKFYRDNRIDIKLFRKKFDYASSHVKLKGLLINEHKNRVVYKTLLSYGSVVDRRDADPSIASVVQLALADKIMHRYSMNSKCTYDLHPYARSYNHLRVMLESIRAPNITRCNMFHLNINTGIIRDAIIQRPVHIDRFISTNYKEAIPVMEGGFISGAGVPGFYQAFKKFEQDGRPITVDWDIFCTALGRMFITFSIDNYKLRPIDNNTYDELSLPRYKIGGMFGGTAYNLEGEGAGRIVTVGTATRLQLRELTIEQMVGLKESFDKGEMKTYDDFPKMIIPTVTKPEPMPQGADPYKQRLVNSVPNLKVAIDSYLAKKFMEQAYRCPLVGIGFKWKHGGAYSLYRYFEADIRDKWTYITLDISRMDKNMREALIAILAYGTTKYAESSPFIKYISRCSATATAVRHLLWHGLLTDKMKPHIVRLVQGSIASGELGTSIIDTMCGLVINFSFDEYIAKKLAIGKDEIFYYFGKPFTARYSQFSVSEWIEQFHSQLIDMSTMKRVAVRSANTCVERPYAPCVDYGDDLLRAWLRKFDPLMIYNHNGKKWPLLFMWFMKTYFCLSAKEEEVDVYDWSVDHPFFTVIHDGKIKRAGPKYLQRRFIYWNGSVMPWRPVDDYYLKASVRTDRSFQPVIYLSVLRGLKIDTMGTNHAAFKFLDDLERCHLRHYLAEGVDLEEELARTLNDEEFVEAYNLKRRLLKCGLQEESVLSSHLTQEQIFEMFKYSDSELAYQEFLIGNPITAFF